MSRLLSITWGKLNSCSFCRRAILAGDFQASSKVSKTTLLLWSHSGINFTRAETSSNPLK
uniref:Uncharacterized protein n=1 Tax=Arundo donax TaxID=35708 RepID=A0A0A9DSV6_ARUDO